MWEITDIAKYDRHLILVSLTILMSLHRHSICLFSLIQYEILMTAHSYLIIFCVEGSFYVNVFISLSYTDTSSYRLC